MGDTKNERTAVRELLAIVDNGINDKITEKQNTHERANYIVCRSKRKKQKVKRNHLVYTSYILNNGRKAGNNILPLGTEGGHRRKFPLFKPLQH